MIVHSFVKNAMEMIPVEVELSLLQGIPKFEIFGLPDKVILESQWRIRSALKKQGFQMPIGKKILVKLTPHHIRKHSRGIELAIACAFLWETGQVPKPDDSLYVYGGISLDGKVEAPDDLDF